MPDNHYGPTLVTPKIIRLQAVITQHHTAVVTALGILPICCEDEDFRVNKIFSFFAAGSLTQKFKGLVSVR